MKLDYSKPEKLADLPKKYPLLFENSWYNKRHKDRAAEKGTPCDPEEVFFHFECNEGWLSLLDNLLHIIYYNLKRFREVQEIEADIVAKGGEVPGWIPEYFEANKYDPFDYFSIAQIKEKFGGLRFYIDFNTEEGEQVISDRIRYSIQGAIDLAESLSSTICELCGNPGKCGNSCGGELLDAYNASLDLSWVTEENYRFYYQAGSGSYIQTLCEQHRQEKEMAAIEQHRKGFAKRKQEYFERRFSDDPN